MLDVVCLCLDLESLRKGIVPFLVMNKAGVQTTTHQGGSALRTMSPAPARKGTVEEQGEVSHQTQEEARQAALC